MSYISLYIESIPNGGTIDLYLAPASAPRRVYQRLWYVISCLWDGEYKRTLAARGFLSRFMNGPLPYVRCHKTILKCVEHIIK